MRTDERELLRLLARELEPGEELRWHGSPGRAWREWRYPYPFLMGLVCVTMGAIALSLASKNHGEAIPAVGVVQVVFWSVLLFAGLVFCSFPFVRRACRKRTLCVVTDRRALLFSALNNSISLTVWQGKLAVPSGERIELHGDDDIVFGYRRIPWASRQGPPVYAPCGFLGIADREGALEAIRRMDYPSAAFAAADGEPILSTGHDREVLGAQLAPGEKLLMVVRPAPRLLSAVCALFFCMGAMAAAMLAAQILKRPYLHAELIPLGLATLLLLSTPWIVRGWRRKGRYALTNKNIYAFSPGEKRWGPRVYKTVSFRSYRVDLRPDGSGDVRINYASPRESDEEEILVGVPQARAFCQAASRYVRRRGSGSARTAAN